MYVYIKDVTCMNNGHYCALRGCTTQPSIYDDIVIIIIIVVYVYVCMYDVLMSVDVCAKE